MVDALEKLRELTDKIPDYNPGFKIGNKLLLEGGLGVATALLKNKNVAVSHTELHKGAKFEEHYHHEREIIIVVSGSLRYVDNNRDITLRATDALVVDPDTVHTAEAITNTEIIVITVPASKGFPDED